MRNFKVIVEHELNGEMGITEYLIEAGGVHITPEWLSFDLGVMGKASDVLAVFPRERVIAVVPVE